MEPTTDAPPRLFTVAEANALLPELKELLADLRHALARLEELRGELQDDDGNLAPPAPDSLVAPTHLKAVLLFHSTVGRVHEIGVELKDVREGLIDFPANIAGQDVLLCWREGEDAVAWYHDSESGFAGRKPLDPDAPE